MRTWTTLQCFKSSVFQTLSYLYVDKQVGHHLRGKKNLFPAAYYYSGCTSQTDTCSHVYDCTASCNSPAKIIYRLGATKKKKATEVSHHRKHLVRAETMEQLWVCIVKGLDIERNIETLLIIAAIKGRTIPWWNKYLGNKAVQRSEWLASKHSVASWLQKNPNGHPPIL